jgi:hypothetical protein
MTYTVLARISFLILVAFVSVSCEPCIVGEGAVVQETFPVDTFQVVSLKGSMNVYVSQNFFPQQVTVKAQKNVIDALRLEVKGGKLTIDSEACFVTTEEVEVYVNTKRVEGLELSGSGDMHTLTELRGSTLNLAVNGSGDMSVEGRFRTMTARLKGSGDIRISGSADRFEASVEGSGDIKAGNMNCLSTSVSVDGSGDAVVNATDFLEAAVNGSGDIRYTGYPADTLLSVNGSGSIKAYR